MKFKHYCNVCCNNWENEKINDFCKLCGNSRTIKIPIGDMEMDLFKNLLLNGADFENKWKYCHVDSTDNEFIFTFKGKFKKIEFEFIIEDKIKKLKLDFDDIKTITRSVNPELDILYYQFYIKKKIKNFNCNQFYIIKYGNYKIAFYDFITYELKIFNLEQLCIE